MWIPTGTALPSPTGVQHLGGGPGHHCAVRSTASPNALRTVADDAGFVTPVTHESGTIQWTYGGQAMRRRAERVNFAPGGRRDEQAMGTNAVSLALRTGRRNTVFSAEGDVSTVRGLASAIEVGLRTELPLRPPEDRPQLRLNCLGTE